VIERIVAALLTAVFVGEVGLAPERLDRLIENRPRLAGIVGVVEIDGGLGRSGLGAGERAQEKNEEKRFMILSG
jgi:hypothetical protein